MGEAYFLQNMKSQSKMESVWPITVSWNQICQPITLVKEQISQLVPNLRPSQYLGMPRNH